MIITFGNQKGGAGKSTLAILFANYLSLVKNKKCSILDLDFQGTVNSKYNKSKNIDTEEPYEVVSLGLEEYLTISEGLKSNEQGIYIIDLPGKLDDNNLIPVLQDTDLFVVPFMYEEGMYESTIVFTLTVRAINPEAPVVFVPNKIRSSVKYILANQIDEELKEYGTVTGKIKELITFERISTKLLPKEQEDNVVQVFEEILNLLNKWEETI